VAAKEQVGLDQPGAVFVESFSGSLLNEAVGRGVTFLLFPKPQAQQDTQPVRFQSQHGIGPAEEKNLLCTRLTNPWKLLECFFGLEQRQLENRSQIAFKLFQGDFRTLAKLFGKLFRHNSMPGHFEERLVGSRKNVRRLGADPFLESLERLLSSVIVS
jgi:hypothetical protein